MTARVDILMPTYKPQKEHLLAAIASVQAQTEQGWTLTICDEPTDVDTRNMLGATLEDERIRYIRNERRLGIGGNWNRCLSHARAPFVQYLFQDDLLAPDYLATALAAMEDKRVGMVSMGHEYTFEGESDARDVYEDVQQAFAALAPGRHDGREALLAWMKRGLHPNIVGEPSFVLLRRDTMEGVGSFREDMQQNLDSEYWARMLIAADWCVVPGNFGSFRVHAAAASARNAARGAGIFDRLRTLQTASGMLPAEHRTQARKIIREQTRRMAEKFLLRYGNTSVQLPKNMHTVWGILLHPIALLRSLCGYARSRNRE